ncbi:MAG TPA: putative LPS assembly protein LptD, partial [Cyclobacteriaceae bacterium]|nr:putative LPS assembly protein LptD [Cyclobacteriaceae bacterium]
VRLTSVGTNLVTNNLGKIGINPAKDSIAPITVNTIPTFFKNSKKGIKFNLPLGTSIKVLKYFTLSPSLSIDEIWYFDKLDWGLNADKTAMVVKDTIKGFNTITNYSGGIGTTTRFYGMYLFKKGKVQAIRHVVNPSIGYSFRPDFGDPKYGYYQRDTLANKQVVYQSRHQGYIYGGSGLGQSNSLSFSINNSLEMKVKNATDSVAKKISLLNTLSASASYNIAADSFKLSTIPLSANTNVLQDKININISASLDPYQYLTISKHENGDSSREIRTSQYSWKRVEPIPNYYVIDRNGTLGRITNASFALGSNLSPKGQKKDNDTRSRIANSDASPTDKKFMLEHPEAYVDFTVPWNLRINYNLNYSKPLNQKGVITQSLRFTGDFSLTEKWKITFNSGYDLEKKAFTQTNIGINRDLHCWQLSMNWVPFGRYQSYSFTIGIKSSLLQSLKLDRNRSFNDVLAN